MKSSYHYSSMENFDELMAVSTRMREIYDYCLGQPLEEWERKTFEDLMLSEKVFDI